MPAIYIMLTVVIFKMVTPYHQYNSSPYNIQPGELILFCVVMIKSDYSDMFLQRLF